MSGTYWSKSGEYSFPVQLSWPSSASSISYAIRDANVVGGVYAAQVGNSLKWAWWTGSKELKIEDRHCDVVGKLFDRKEAAMKHVENLTK
jgi:hypothetical protein